VERLRSLTEMTYYQVRAATSLLSITHSLKLLLLLSDEKEIVRRRDEAAERIQHETTEAQQRVLVALDKLLGRTKEAPDVGSDTQMVENSNEVVLQEREEV
jgi:mediator of RNA polymerase II transcription subunit 22